MENSASCCNIRSGFNYVMYRKREEICEYINHLLEFHLQFIPKNQKICKLDLIGIVCNSVVLSLSIVPWVAWIGLVVSCLGPVSLAFNKMSFLEIPALNYFIQIITAPLNLYIALETCRSLRFTLSVFLTCLDVSMEIVKHVEELSRMHLPKAIQKYQYFFLRVHNLCQNACSYIFAVGLGFGFWMVVVDGTICLLGRKILL